MRGSTGNMFKALKITVAAASLSLLWGVGGCVSYTSVPEPSKGIALGHTNSGGSIKTVVASIERVVLRHPMRDDQGNYAVNLPVGTTPETAETIVSRLPTGAVLPYAGMSGSVPVYHIGRIWLRGASGKVDVVYPMLDADGQRIDGGVTVWVHGGDQPWYVQRMQYWAPGTVPTPSMYVPVGKAGAGDAEMKDVDGYENPMTETELETDPVQEPGPVDDDGTYREIDE